VNAKQFRKFVDRDEGCVHCGELEAIAPHHRLGRGMGGSKSRDVPSNIIVVCSWLNFMMESDATVAEVARHNGWKLRAGQVPHEEPVYYQTMDLWGTIDDNFLVDWIPKHGDELSFF
jgi:hypothetical protein